jgi:hypothetical protein
MSSFYYIDSFYYAHATDFIGRMSGIKLGLTELDHEILSFNSGLQGLQHDLDSLQSLWDIIFYQIELETDSMTLVGLYEDASDLEALMTSLQEDLDNEKLNFTSVYTDLVDSLAALVIALTADSTYEIAIMRNYEILVSYLQDSSVLQADLNDLAEIATECMDEFGSAVPYSQNLMIALGSIYHKKDSCGSQNFAELTSRIVEKVPSATYLYPNPNQGSFVLLLGDKFGKKEKTILTITDLLGKQVYFQTLNPVSSIVDLNLNSLPAGVYNLAISQGKHCDYRNLIITR